RHTGEVQPPATVVRLNEDIASGEVRVSEGLFELVEVSVSLEDVLDVHALYLKDKGKFIALKHLPFGAGPIESVEHGPVCEVEAIEPLRCTLSVLVGTIIQSS